MSRTICRKAPMKGAVKMRAHEEDIANIKLAAMNKGMDVSTFLRQVLIQQGIINTL